MNDITIPARVIFNIGPLPITDAILGAALTAAIIFGCLFLASRKFSIIPTKAQVMLEMLTEYVMEQLESAFHSRERAEKFFPFFMTMLIFLLIANQLVLVPFIFNITYGSGELLRLPTSDFSQPIALALVIFFISHVMALKISPLNHIGNFIVVKPLLKARTPMQFFQALVEFFVGFLNIIGEFAKIVSLSARLFGNIFAGEVMVGVVIGLAAWTQFIVPVPFIVLSQFAGLVQAFVFYLLSMQFIALAIDDATPSTEEDVLEPQPAAA